MKSPEILAQENLSSGAIEARLDPHSPQYDPDFSKQLSLDVGIDLDSLPGATLLTPKQAAETLGVTENTLAVWRSSGRYSLPFVKVGRKVAYRVADLRLFIERRTVGGEAS